MVAFDHDIVPGCLFCKVIYLADKRISPLSALKINFESHIMVQCVIDFTLFFFKFCEHQIYIWCC